MSEPRPPLLAGKYELIRPVGKGGMASVWLALNHGEAGFKRKVAIKRLLKHRTEDAAFAAMFVEEARVVAELAHPNIVQIYDFAVDADGRFFIVMEWVEGLGLDAYSFAYARSNVRVPWYLVTGIMIEVLRALQAAHERLDDAGNPAPVIHRDVAPANVLVGRAGTVKLTDFGLARAMDRPSRTDPGIVKGKIGYMAPELLRGRSPSPGSDIYSLGVTFWETLCGRRLFGGDGTDVSNALRVLKEDPPPLDGQRPDLPIPLVRVVHRALAREPEDRYPSAAAMIMALTGILRELPHHTGSSALADSVREAQALLEQLRTSSPPRHPA